MNASVPWSVRLCLFYNRLFRFRNARYSLIQDRLQAEERRKQDARKEDLRYAEVEYQKTARYVQRFGDVPLAGRRVLEFGCLFGGACLWFADQGAAQVIGVDTDGYGLDVAREFVRSRSADHDRQNRIDFRQGGTRSIPVESESIDLICSEDVVEHLADPAAIFAEWHRVLVPGGKVLLSFGPLWYHPHGVHLWEVFPAPWSHVLFSDRTCVMTRNYLKGQGCTGTHWTDYNKMSLAKFHRLVRASSFRQEWCRVLAVWGMKPLLRIPVLKELFASEVHSVLVK